VPELPRDAEWLLADGGGGYACGAVDDLARRRYHGLWTVRPAGSARRMLVVAGVDERVLDGERTLHLMHAHWRDLQAPSPPQARIDFAPRPLPSWTFTALAGSDVRIERTVALRSAIAGGPPLLVVRWTNRSPRWLRLVVRPLLGWGDADHLMHAHDGFDGTVHARGASWGVRPDGTLPMLWLTAAGIAAFRGEATWYRGFFFGEDRARGYDHHGDRWNPGVLEIDLAAGSDATVAFALGEPCGDPAATFDGLAAAAVQQERAVATARDPLRARLERSAGDFLFRADGGRLGVLAGFPWFCEWGRDVFIALPGLTLARGRKDLCAEALTGALPFLQKGLLPNVYGPTPADSRYNSCDAALWFSLAVQRFADAGGEPQLVRGKLLKALASIADAYVAGAELGLCVDRAGLLCAGGEHLNATWMDAETAKGPVTPRAGLPVEIQALWYSLLAFLAEHDAKWQAARDRCGSAFVRQFWLADTKYLADRVCDGVADRSVRPNMVLAAALPRSPLTAEQRAAVVTKVRGELLTPRGLRTLSPLDRAYRARYEGGPESRDTSYHQGTAWPWLMGFFVEASLAAAGSKGRRAEAKALRAWLDGLWPELFRAGLDHVSEVFDGDEPQRPGGTFAQAWNSGELLRALALCEQAQADQATS